jgi:hypothetical protein
VRDVLAEEATMKFSFRRDYDHKDQARNGALDWLEDEGAEFNGRVQKVNQKFGPNAGNQCGVECDDPNQDWWRLRQDEDHYNAETKGKNGHFFWRKK